MRNPLSMTRKPSPCCTCEGRGKRRKGSCACVDEKPKRAAQAIAIARKTRQPIEGTFLASGLVVQVATAELKCLRINNIPAFLKWPIDNKGVLGFDCTVYPLSSLVPRRALHSFPTCPAPPSCRT